MKKVVIAQNISFYAWHMRFNLAKALRENGYEVIFVSSSDQFISSDKKISSSGDIYSQKIKEEFQYFDISISRKGTNPLTDIKTLYEFYKTYKIIKPDIILHYTAKPNIYGTIAANLLGIPVINNIAGLGTLFIKQSPLTTIVKKLYKFSQKRANKVFFQNTDDMNLFINNSLITRDQCSLLPGSGVDLKKFAPIETKKENSTVKFLLIARLLKDKGLLEFIDAIKIIKSSYQNVHFEILGALDHGNKTAISKETLQTWIDDKLINYLGVTDDVKSVIAASDCVVLPSYREGVPRSLLEASAMGKPIIASNAVGCKEVVEDGITGYLCEVKNSLDLAKQLEKMINLSNSERETMGKKGREKIVKEFDEKIVFDRYLQGIEEVLK